VVQLVVQLVFMQQAVQIQHLVLPIPPLVVVVLEVTVVQLKMDTMEVLVVVALAKHQGQVGAVLLLLGKVSTEEVRLLWAVVKLQVVVVVVQLVQAEMPLVMRAHTHLETGVPEFKTQ
jgi:hypothetical protein